MRAAPCVTEAIFSSHPIIGIHLVSSTRKQDYYPSNNRGLKPSYEEQKNNPRVSCHRPVDVIHQRQVEELRGSSLPISTPLSHFKGGFPGERSPVCAKKTKYTSFVRFTVEGNT